MKIAKVGKKINLTKMLKEEKKAAIQAQKEATIAKKEARFDAFTREVARSIISEMVKRPTLEVFTRTKSHFSAIV